MQATPDGTETRFDLVLIDAAGTPCPNRRRGLAHYREGDQKHVRAHPTGSAAALESNGEDHEVAAPLDLTGGLRYKLGLTGTKQGCDKEIAVHAPC